MEIDLDEELARLWNALEINNYTKLDTMRSTFPDLRIFRNDRGKLLMCTTENNSSADRLDISVPAEEGPVVVSFFTVLPTDGRLYSLPPFFEIGHAAPSSFGVIPKEGWKEELTNAKISSKMIEKISDFLSKNAPFSYT